VPLAICYPDKDFLLIDSLAKRVSFIDEACAKLGIGNVRTLHARAEDAGSIKGTPAPPLRESFDLAVSRAVAHLAVLYEYCLPLVKPGGAFYAYKSESQIDEIGESKKARLLLGATEDAEVWSAETLGMNRPQQPTQTHIIIITRKENPTPKAYPRKAGTPVKTPL
jgi:16S rRNA (guanine527-N7)-methyltransferase